MKFLGALSLAFAMLGAMGVSVSRATNKPLRFPFVSQGHGTYSQDPEKSRYQFDKACFHFVYDAVGKSISTEPHLSERLTLLCHGGSDKLCKSWTTDLVNSMRLDERESQFARSDLAAVIKDKNYISWCSKVFDDVTSSPEGQKGPFKSMSIEQPALVKPGAKKATPVSTTTTTTTSTTKATATATTTMKAATTMKATTTTKVTTTTKASTTTKATTTAKATTTMKATTTTKATTTQKPVVKATTTTKAPTTAKPAAKAATTTKAQTTTTTRPAVTTTKAALRANVTAKVTKTQAVAKAAPAVSHSAVQSQSKRLRAQTTTNSSAATNSTSKDCACVHHHGKKICHCLGEKKH